MSTYKCSCGRAFETEKGLNIHKFRCGKPKQENPKSFTCPVCQRNFNKQGFSMHIRMAECKVHLSQEYFTEGFDYLFKLNLYAPDQTEGRDYFVCELCKAKGIKSNRFASKKSLRRHHVHCIYSRKLKEQENEEKPYHCPVCDRGFTKLKGFSHHIRRSKCKPKVAEKFFTETFDYLFEEGLYAQDMVEDIDYVICQVCIEEGRLSNRHALLSFHLTIHNLNKEQYQALYPDAPIICETLVNTRIENTTKSWRARGVEVPIKAEPWVDPKGPYKCPICAESFISLRALGWHIRKSATCKSKIDPLYFEEVSYGRDYVLKIGIYHLAAVEDKDYVICQVCKASGNPLCRFKSLVSHLIRTHKISIEAYRMTYPETKLRAQIALQGLDLNIQELEERGILCFKCPCGSIIATQPGKNFPKTLAVHIALCQHIQKGELDRILKRNLYSPGMVEGRDYIVCQLCKEEGKSDRWRKMGGHVHHHDLTFEEFNVLYPDHPIECTEIYERRKQTNLERSGLENPFKGEELIQRTRDRFKDPEFVRARQRKIEATNLSRYGVKNPFTLYNKVLLLMRLKTRCEARFDELTLEHITYVGNGKFWRGLPGSHRSVCPDFVVQPIKLSKRVIEIFGVYHHSLKLGITKAEAERLKIADLKKAGLDCLIIWDDDLFANSEKELRRAEEFCGPFWALNPEHKKLLHDFGNDKVMTTAQLYKLSLEDIKQLINDDGFFQVHYDAEDPFFPETPQL